MPSETEKFGQRLWFEFSVTRAQSGLLVNMVHLVLRNMVHLVLRTSVQAPVVTPTKAPVIAPLASVGSNVFINEIMHNPQTADDTLGA
jgi:hypothetical protein